MADNSKQGFLNTLFQWTVKNTAAEATPTTTAETVQPMTEENKTWLHDALESISVNPVERIKICIAQIKDATTTEEQKKQFLAELCHWSEELDLSKDFFTIGGLDILGPLLENSDDQIRMETCSLLATLVQNHPHCQRIIVQSGLQEKLLKILEHSTNPDLQTKAVTAISALIRGYTLGQLQLQKFQGHKILVRSLSIPHSRLQNKLCFLINTICSSSTQMKKIFFESGALVEFVRLFNQDDCPDHQHILETILTFATAKPNSFVDVDSLLIEKFQENLDQREKSFDKSEDHDHEIALIQQIKSHLNSSKK